MFNVVDDKTVRVFVNDACASSLVVNRLATTSARRPVGFFVDFADGRFANVGVGH